MIVHNLITSLEKDINVQFNDKNLLLEAITHSSYANQIKNAKYNERLEFLGDSVLQLCISEHLFKNYYSKSEGELTKIRSLIVCENSLFDIAVRLNLGKYMLMSKGEELTGGRSRTSILADCVEAVIAAVYLDKGIEEVKRFVISLFNEIIEKAVNNQIVLDHKTKLQELLQQKGEASITYNLVKQEGPPHRRMFYTEVIIDNKLCGYGSGYSKKESEQSAAKEALIHLEETNE
jgi:ribonuclease-3